MADVYHVWGNDLVAGAFSVPVTGIVDTSGDLLTVGGHSDGSNLFAQKTVQRLLRRLLTNPGEMWFHPDYGAGLGRYLGQPLNKPVMTAAIRGQIFQEAAVAQSPAPVITLTTQKDGTVLCHILYTDAETGKPIPLSFSISA